MEIDECRADHGNQHERRTTPGRATCRARARASSRCPHLYRRGGSIQAWNGAAEQLFGFSRDEAVGQNLDLIIPEELRAAHWRRFDAAVSSGRLRLGGRPTLTRAVHKSGSRRYVEMSFALVFDETRQVVGSVATARDVTAKVEREKAQAPGARPPCKRSRTGR